MEKVLQNEYLLNEILQAFEDRDDQVPDITTMHSAALVCRAFRKPAEDKLWRTLESLLPILKLLPTFHFSRESGSWFLHGPIRSVDIERLLQVTARVQRIFLSREYKVEASTYLALSRALGERPLLPNLRDLDISVRSPPATSTIGLQLLISPNQTSISLAMNSNNIDNVNSPNHHDCSLYMQRLASENAIGITLVSIVNIKPVPEVLDAIFSFKNLSQLQLQVRSLTEGDISGIDGQVFLERLAALENLASLNLSVFLFNWNSMESQKLIHMPNLTELKLDCCTVLLCSQILQSLKFDALNTFSLQFSLPDPNQPHDSVFPWRRFFGALEACSLSKLSLVKLYLSSSNPPNLGTQSAEQLQQLYPGLSFDGWRQHLLRFKFRDLRIKFPLFPSLSNDDLNIMAVAWPALELLNLSSATHISLFNTSALGLICNSFPNLQDLSLDINASQVDKPPHNLSWHKLRKLELNLLNWSRRTDDVKRLAALVDTLFPFVIAFAGNGWEITEPINEQLQELQAARTRERRRMAVIGNRRL
ncbi:hypothetical protein CVT24_013178 [Panaeolus cyanescens]|uniref:F-box domain-containing protein n=1 Tax=Panaeolus cyanescens TaxID=181874 RepID=A0A409VW06_9AGAR|nr:hypothetical protein CVT24_013178 [Panaeolus cyanescens]